MYTPPHFEIDLLPDLHAVIDACGLAQFVTGTSSGLLCTPLPLFLESGEGRFGTLYGHLARANDQWRTPPQHEALAIFPTADAYITPAWYTTKQETGKVVPTWNYETVHAYGAPEFFESPERLLDVVTRLTRLHEGQRATPWQVTDAPADFIAGQLRGIVGIRMPIARLEGKRKMSQNRPATDRGGVARGLLASPHEADRVAGSMVAHEADKPARQGVIRR